jgi:hypothetical protein
LKCSAEEIKESGTGKEFSWDFEYQSKYLTESFVLRSDMEADVGKEMAYYSGENENFNTITYDLKVDQSGNALSIFTSYNFETVMLALTLKDTKTNNIIALEKLASLEEITNN